MAPITSMGRRVFVGGWVCDTDVVVADLRPRQRASRTPGPPPSRVGRGRQRWGQSRARRAVQSAESRVHTVLYACRDGAKRDAQMARRKERLAGCAGGNELIRVRGALKTHTYMN